MFPARDPYNSKPCEEPDDPCYCTGPKKPQKTQLACRNTDPYCLHIPKGENHFTVVRAIESKVS